MKAFLIASSILVGLLIFTACALSMVGSSFAPTRNVNGTPYLPPPTTTTTTPPPTTTTTTTELPLPPTESEPFPDVVPNIDTKDHISCRGFKCGFNW